MIKVAQCWDDGVATDIRLVSIFKKYGAKATFNLCPGQIPDETIMPYWKQQPYYGGGHIGFVGGKVGKDRLKEVFGDFCVATHCWKHENPAKVPLDQFVKSALDTRKFLEDFFQKECPGFAWPFGAFTDDSVKALADAGFAYGRTCANVDDVKNGYKCPMLLNSNCHFLNNDFWTRFENAKKNHNEYFYFWGHSYEMLDCEGLWNQLEEKIRLLSSDPEVEWVDVVDIVR